jgi:hypothetical protein
LSKKIALLSARLYQAIPMQKQIFTLAVLTLCTSSTFVLGATDTPETRRREAERYLQATPPRALFEDIADKMAMSLPPAERDKFKQMLTSQLDVPALTKAMTDAMVKKFTIEELKALADLMPTMQAEIVKAQTKANQSLPNQSPR